MFCPDFVQEVENVGVRPVPSDTEFRHYVVGPASSVLKFAAAMKTHNFLIFIAGLVLGLVSASKCTERHGVEAVPTVTDTVVVRDTLTVLRPVERVRTAVGRTVAALPVADGRAAADSVRVEVPLERVVYDTDSFRAVLTGYEARLDTLQLRRELTRITTTATAAGYAKPPSRWGVSVTAGVGVTPHGVEPMVAVGVSYRLWSF